MIFIQNLKTPVLAAIVLFTYTACQKATTAPSVLKPAAFTVVNVIPNSAPIVPVFNTSSDIEFFGTALAIGYPGFSEYSPSAGNDTLYVVQQNNDTLDIGPKATGLMFYSILNLKAGGIYSLFLTGADTSSPDYLLTTDSLTYHGPADSAVGIRFVNLSTGSNPMSINLEGSPNGSEVINLPYKGITGFKDYVCNSTMTNSAYLFVIRDVATGDSLTSYTLYGFGVGNVGTGLEDPNGNALTFKNVTIAVYGSENSSSNFPLGTSLIDDY
jgi:hypothetical protein